MASNLAGGYCISQAKVCRLRVATLSAACAPVPGADQAAVTAGILTMTRAAEISEGTEYEFKNGCGEIIAQAKDADRIKWFNLTGELQVMDYELLKVMFGGSLILADVGEDYAGKVIGYCRPSGSATPPSVSLEIWTQTVIGTAGGCSSDANAPQYVRHVFPRAVFVEGDRTFEDGTGTISFTARAYENPAWGNGPWNDFPGVYPACTDTAHLEFIEKQLPANVVNGGCGYVTVPADVS